MGSGGGKTYLFYSTTERMPALDYRDIDGAPIIESRTFASQREADEWVRSDLAWRTTAEQGRSQ